MSPRAGFIGLLILASASALIAFMNTATTVDRAAMVNIDLALLEAVRAEEIHFATQEVDLTLAEGTFVGYTSDLALLQQEGLHVPENVQLRIPRADAVGYCIEARFEDGNGVWHATKENPSTSEGTC